MNELSPSKNRKLHDNPSVSSIDKNLMQAQNKLKTRIKATLLGRLVNLLLSSPRLHFLHLKLYSHFSNYQKEASEQGILRNRVSFFLEAKKAVDAQQKTEDAGTKVLTKNPLQNIVENQSPQPETVNPQPGTVHIEIPPKSDHQVAVPLQPQVEIPPNATNLDVQTHLKDVQAQPEVPAQPDIVESQPEPPQADVPAQPDSVAAQADIPKPSDSIQKPAQPDTPSISDEKRLIILKVISDVEVATQNYLVSLDARIKKADEEYQPLKKELQSIDEQIDKANKDIEYAYTFLAKLQNWGTTPDTSKIQTRLESLETRKKKVEKIYFEKSQSLAYLKNEKENFKQLEQRFFGGEGGYAKLPHINSDMPVMRISRNGSLAFIVKAKQILENGDIQRQHLIFLQQGEGWIDQNGNWLQLEVPPNRTPHHATISSGIEELLMTGDAYFLDRNGKPYNLHLDADEQYLAELEKNSAVSIAKMEASSFDAAPGLKDIFGSKAQFDRLPLLPRKIDFGKDIDSQITDKDMEKNAIMRFQDGKGRYGFAVRGKVKFGNEPEKIGIQAFYTDPQKPNRWKSGRKLLTDYSGSFFDEKWLKSTGMKFHDRENIESYHAYLKAILVKGEGSFKYSNGLRIVTLEPFTPLR